MREELVKRLLEIQERICNLTFKSRDIIRKLAECETDWMSVKKASEAFDLSTSAIYARINSGVLESHYIGSKHYIRRSELEALDEKVPQYTV